SLPAALPISARGAAFQAPVGADPAPVHADLAAAHDLVDQRTRRPLQVAQQEIVQPLAIAVLGDADGAYAAGGGGLAWISHVLRVPGLWPAPFEGRPA